MPSGGGFPDRLIGALVEERSIACGIVVSDGGTGLRALSGVVVDLAIDGIA
jgi:hypothetical protein